jgi:hypothetical protein
MNIYLKHKLYILKYIILRLFIILSPASFEKSKLIYLTDFEKYMHSTRIKHTYPFC